MIIQKSRITLLVLIGIILTVAFVFIVERGSDDTTVLEQSPLLRALSHVPDSETSRQDTIDYIDIEAIMRAFPPAEIPTSYDDYRNRVNDYVPYQIYTRLISLLYPRRFTQLTNLRNAQDMTPITGVNYFNIRQGLRFGHLPDESLVLHGNFDIGTAQTTLSEAGFERQSEDVNHWCWAEGCDTTNGRRYQPIVLDQSILFTSADDQTTRQYINTQIGTQPTLADVPRYVAIAEVLEKHGTVFQASIIDYPTLEPWTRLPTFNYNAIGIYQSEEDRLQYLEDLIEETVVDFVILPKYQLIALADVMNESTQDTLVALVYDDEGDAKIAAEILPLRIGDYKTWRGLDFVDEILSTALITHVGVDTTQAENGLWVVLITFPSPRVPGELVLEETEVTLEDYAGSPDLAAPSLMYEILVQYFQIYDIAWLSMITVEGMQDLSNWVVAADYPIGD